MRECVILLKDEAISMEEQEELLFWDRYLVYVPDSQGVILNNPIVPSANAQEPCADVEPTSGRWSDTHQEMSEAAVDQQNVN
uniref:Uncharacterized protein n=1 Tax=Caenorhabditis japonica TaxID=281687 RepID=A0A8R1ESU9_CAEJA